MRPKLPDSELNGQRRRTSRSREQRHAAKPSPFLGIIDGPTGAGKSAVLEHLMARHSASCVISSKLTTRPRRTTDSAWELQFVDTIPASLVDFSYASVGWQYAIDVRQIEQALRGGRACFLTCTDPATTRALARRFPAVVIYVHRVISHVALSELLAARTTTTDEEARLRLSEVAEAVSRYAANIGLYDFVLLNVTDLAELHRQVDAILAGATERVRSRRSARTAAR